MAVYLGSGEKVKITLGNVTYCLNFFSEALLVSGVLLISSDDYALQDSNGLYLTVKEDE